MTIELDSTLAQAEVLFLSFAQLVADMDRRRVEEPSSLSNELRRRGHPSGSARTAAKPSVPPLSEELRELLQAGR